MDITVSELKERLENAQDFYFIDVREPYEFQEANLGAKLVPLGSFPGIIPELGIPKDAEIIIHCRSGARSNAAVQMMRSEGYTNVRNVIGGILAWAALYPVNS